jgi:hypothetical protein
MDLWIQCGKENAVFTKGQKKFTETAKGEAGQVKPESHVDGYLTLKTLLHKGANGMKL